MAGRRNSLSDVLVAIPTYNEAGNVEQIVGAVLAACDRTDVLVIDDDSPDGTGDIAEGLSASSPRVFVLRRHGRRGLGAAYKACFRWALCRHYQRVIQMDADFSHDPKEIPRILECCERCDLAIGSRYCRGGRTGDWPGRRKWLSLTANLYARTLLASRIRDLTGGFRCWRREALERIDLAAVRGNDYAFPVEMAYLAEAGGFRIREIPITFRQRRKGASKMSLKAVAESIVLTARLGWERLSGKRHPALLPGPQSDM